MSEEITEVIDSPAILDDSGNFTEDFYNSFEEDDRSAVSQYKNPSELGKGHVNLRRKFNKPADRLLVIPDENSSDAERAEYYQRLGVPENVEDYKFELRPDLKNVEVDEEKINAFRQIAKQRNIPQSEFNEIVNDYLALVDKDIGAFDLIQEDKEKQAFEEAQKILKTHMGKSYDERIARANVLLTKYGNIELKDEQGQVIGTVGEKLIEAFPNLKNSPWMAMVLDAIAEDMSEDRIKGLTHISSPTNAAIKSKITQLRNSEAYTDMSHPDHKRINQEVLDLYKQLS